MFGRRRRQRDDNIETTDGVEEALEVESDGTSGPYDSADAPDDDIRRLDLGSLRVPTPSGVEARMQTDDKGNVRQITLIAGDSAVQIGVFAAPRSEGIWDEVREEIAASAVKQGGRAEEVLDGEYGVELLVKSNGQQGTGAARFVGVDGPRWFIRAVFQGARAADPQASPVLDECLRGVVVDRGNQAMPVLEALPLRLPPAMAEQAKARAAADKAKREAGVKAAGITLGGVNGSDQAPSQGRKRKPSPGPKKR